ncbi:hypothetical protein BDZ89DRAFT_810098 [Hymenopellis radicata]|nr:hypothetical protein BDZ89DRAFT_810098 [Hymenopellis radicata]
MRLPLIPSEDLPSTSAILALPLLLLFSSCFPFTLRFPSILRAQLLQTGLPFQIFSVRP